MEIICCLCFGKKLKFYEESYYVLLISRRAQLSKHALVLKNDFNLTEDQLEKVFLLPHMVCFDSYVKAFQYKVLNSILYTNAKLFKIGYIAEDKCTFCKSESETLIHLYFNNVKNVVPINPLTAE